MIHGPQEKGQHKIIVVPEGEEWETRVDLLVREIKLETHDAGDAWASESRKLIDPSAISMTKAFLQNT